MAAVTSEIGLDESTDVLLEVEGVLPIINSNSITTPPPETSAPLSPVTEPVQFVDKHTAVYHVQHSESEAVIDVISVAPVTASVSEAAFITQNSSDFALAALSDDPPPIDDIVSPMPEGAPTGISDTSAIALDQDVAAEEVKPGDVVNGEEEEDDPTISHAEVNPAPAENSMQFGNAVTSQLSPEQPPEVTDPAIHVDTVPQPVTSPTDLPGQKAHQIEGHTIESPSRGLVSNVEREDVVAVANAVDGEEPESADGDTDGDKLNASLTISVQGEESEDVITATETIITQGEEDEGETGEIGLLVKLILQAYV